MPNVREYFKSRSNEASTEQYQKEIRRHRRKVIIIVISIFLVLLVLAGIAYYVNQNRHYNDFSILSNLERKDTDNTYYMSYGNRVVKYNKDGISCMEKNSKLVWNQSFEMKTPMVDICGKYVAVCDKEGNKVYILNEDGLQGEVDTQLPILKLQVAGQGVVAVMMEEDNVNRINYYDKKGTLLAENKAPVEKSGFPMDITLSDDGMKLAVSYLVLNNGILKSQIAFYNFDSVGENVIDHLVSAADYEGSVVPKIEFINRNTAVVFGDDFYSVFQGTQKPVSICEKKVNKEIQSVFYNQDYFGLVFLGDNPDKPYQLEIYNQKGNKVSSIDTNIHYTDVKLVDQYVYIIGETECAMYSVKGKEKFSKTLSENISAWIPITERDIFAVLENRIQELRLK